MTLVQVAGDTLIHRSTQPWSPPPHPPNQSAALITSFLAPSWPTGHTHTLAMRDRHLGSSLVHICSQWGLEWLGGKLLTGLLKEMIVSLQQMLEWDWKSAAVASLPSLLGLFLYIIYNNSNSEGILSSLFVNISLSTLPRCLKTLFSLRTQCGRSGLSFLKGGLVNKCACLHSALPCNWAAVKGTGCGCDYPADAPE